MPVGMASHSLEFGLCKVCCLNLGVASCSNTLLAGSIDVRGGRVPATFDLCHVPLLASQKWVMRLRTQVELQAWSGWKISVGDDVEMVLLHPSGKWVVSLRGGVVEWHCVCFGVVKAV